MNLPILIVIISFVVMGYCQQIDPTEYCTDLIPKRNLTINKLLGTWFGAEIMTHRNMISGEKSSKDCIFVVITEIGYEMATMRPAPGKPQEVVTQFGPRSTSSNEFKDYRYLKLDWTDLDEKNEYILRYNKTRNGFWIASSPHQQSRYAEQASYGAFSGLVQVIMGDDNYLSLIFCETLPQQKIFSVLLARHSNSISDDVLWKYRNEVRNRGLPTITQRRVCSGVGVINYSYLLAITAAIAYLVQSKWIQLVL